MPLDRTTLMALFELAERSRASAQHSVAQSRSMTTRRELRRSSEAVERRILGEHAAALRRSS